MELLQVVRERSAAMTRARTAATAAALTATLGLAAASWVVAVRQMSGMDMGVPVALAITGLGILSVTAPSLVPGLTPPM